MAVTVLDGRREASAVDSRDGSIWFVRGGVLNRCAGALSPPEPRFDLGELAGSYAACLLMLRSGAMLISFEESGVVLRLDTTAPDARPTTVLRLSHPQAFVRTPTATQSAAGVVWLGEYGTFPGARCARVYRSTDDGHSFRAVQHFRRARHLHSLACLPGAERVLATTGDVAPERKTYLGSASGRSFRPALHAWAGFTAIAFSGDYVHFGTDLPEQNGFLRMDQQLAGRPEYRPLQGEHDLQVRQIEHVGDGRLIALGCMDENLPERRATRRAALFWSRDHGASWSCVHRFAADWSDAPERFVVPGDRRHLITDGTTVGYAIALPT